MPQRGSIKEGIAFAREKAAWLKAHLREMPPPVPFEDGAIIPVYGKPRRIRHTEELFRGAWLTASELRVSAPPEIVGDYVRRWLRGEADDTALVDDVAHNFARLVEAWRATRPDRQQDGRKQEAR